MSRMLGFLRASLRAAVVIAALSPLVAVADPLSERQVLAVFSSGTVIIPDGVSEGDVAQAISLESGVGQILTSFGIDQISRAFPEFDRADTVGVAYTGETVHTTDWSKVWLLTLPEGGSPENLITALFANTSTVIAETNGEGIGFAAPKYPNDPYFVSGSQWGLWTPAQTGGANKDVDAPEAWGVTTGSPLINVGIIDGGIGNTHPDLGTRVISTNGAGKTPGHAHRVGGIVGAKSNNGIGVTGVDWVAGLKSRIGGTQESDQTTITSVNVLSPASTGNCRVLNASWGLVTQNLQLPRYSTLVEAAFKDHHVRNGVSICAIGNRGLGGARDYPANYQHGVISVGAIDQSNVRWSLSSTGPALDLVAPGVDVWTTDSTGAYTQATGTSYAAPFVAGAASLLYAKQTTLNADDVENILRLTADDIGPANAPPSDLNTNALPTWADTLTGAGRLNIRGALRVLDPPHRFASVFKGETLSGSK